MAQQDVQADVLVVKAYVQALTANVQAIKADLQAVTASAQLFKMDYSVWKFDERGLTFLGRPIFNTEAMFKNFNQQAHEGSLAAVNRVEQAGQNAVNRGAARIENIYGATRARLTALGQQSIAAARSAGASVAQAVGRVASIQAGLPRIEQQVQQAATKATATDRTVVATERKVVSLEKKVAGFEKALDGTGNALGKFTGEVKRADDAME